MNNRRKLLVVLGAATFTPQVIFAQSKQPILIGWLSSGSRAVSRRYLTDFKEGMAAPGWKEGSNYVLEERWADGHTDRLPGLAEELAARKPAIIVATPTTTARAAAKAAPKTPVVVIGGDPVFAGLAASHARPGGMVTGLSTVNTEISEKYLELLLAAAPKSRRVGFLLETTGAGFPLHKENVRRSVAQHKVEARFAEVARPEEIEPALSRLAKEGVQALVVLPMPSLAVERRRILKFALAQRWPVVGSGAAWAVEGALLGYGTDRSAMYRRAAYYVDRILKGAKPADLPIERPMKFELVLNMKTAKTLGIKIPNSILVQATKVIE